MAASGSVEPEGAVRFMGKTADGALFLYPEFALAKLFTQGRFVIERGPLHDFLDLVVSWTMVDEKKMRQDRKPKRPI